MLTFEAPLVRVRLGKTVGFAEQAPPPRVQPPSPSARLLALAHRIAWAVEVGEVRDFSEAAARMGVSQARVSMVVGLTFLAPEIQAGVLLGTGRRISHKRLLRLARLEAWEDQLEALETAERLSGKKSPDRNPRAETGPNLAPNPLESGGIPMRKGRGSGRSALLEQGNEDARNRGKPAACATSR